MIDGSKILQRIVEITLEAEQGAHDHVVEFKSLVQSIKEDVAILRLQVQGGRFRGASLLWLLNHLATFDQYQFSFLITLSVFIDKLTALDFFSKVSAGEHENITILWELARRAYLYGQTEAFDCVWAHCSQHFTWGQLQASGKLGDRDRSIYALVLLRQIQNPSVFNTPIIARNLISADKKFLLAVDLDYTHFVTGREGVNWIKSAEYWVKMYTELVDLAAKNGVGLVFAIVSAKRDCDDLVLAAMQAFRPFLEKYHPYMYIDKGASAWGLVNVVGKLQYILLDNEHSKSSFVPINACSLVRIVAE